MWSQPDISERLVPVLGEAGFQQADFDDFQKRFQPGGCYPQFDDSQIWILLGYLAQEAFVAARLDPYSGNTDTYKIQVPAKSDRETGVHHRLKQEATEWLHSKGALQISYEEGYYSGICDVMDESAKWFIECGASRPSKVWQMFECSDTVDKRLVFFNDNGITIFEAGPKIEEYRSIVHKQMADIAQKLHERRKGF